MDEALLLWINQTWAHPLLDGFFSLLSSKRAFAFPFAVMLLISFVWRWRTAGVQLWLVMFLVVGSGDLLGNGLKHIFTQARPCYAIAKQVRQLQGEPGKPCGSNLSGMPSNHAVNSFAAAAFLSLILRRGLWSGILFTLAALVALSRVYLAKHYPSQIAIGAIVGTVWGLAWAWLGLRYLPFIQGLRGKDPPGNLYHE